MGGESRCVIGENSSAALGACAAYVEPMYDAEFAEDVVAGEADGVVALIVFGLFAVLRGILRSGGRCKMLPTDRADFVLD